jgi:hypothetical protein
MTDDEIISLAITLALMCVIGLLMFIAHKMRFKPMTDEYQDSDNWGAKRHRQTWLFAAQNKFHPARRRLLSAGRFIAGIWQ